MQGLRRVGRLAVLNGVFRLRKRSAGAVIVNSVLVTAVIMAVLLLIPTRPPYLVIDAEAETLLYRVARPEIAGVAVIGARVAPLPEACAPLANEDGRFDVLVRPEAGTLVRYRWSPQAIAVELEGAGGRAGTLIRHDETVCDLPERARVVFPFPEPASPSERPLAIAGPAEIGVEHGAPLAPRAGQMRVFGEMHGGSVKVFGRAILPPLRDALYPAQDGEFPIPAGGRLTSGVSLAPGEGEAAPWYGMARAGARGFEISATTESDNLRLYRPGVSQESETFAVSVLARLFGDPSVSYLSLAILTFTVVMQMIAGWMEFWRDGDEVGTAPTGDAATTPERRDAEADAAAPAVAAPAVAAPEGVTPTPPERQA